MFALTPDFDIEMGAPPVKATAVQQVQATVNAVALAADDEACAAVMLEEVYEPVLAGHEMDSTLAGAFKLDAHIGNWQAEDPQAEALALARELQHGFGDDAPSW